MKRAFVNYQLKNENDETSEQLKLFLENFRNLCDEFELHHITYLYEFFSLPLSLTPEKYLDNTWFCWEFIEENKEVKFSIFYNQRNHENNIYIIEPLFIKNEEFNRFLMNKKNYKITGIYKKENGKVEDWSLNTEVTFEDLFD